MPSPEFKPTKIIVHHSLTKDSETVSWGAIRSYHIHTLGYSDIGYHAGVELTSHGYYEVLWGRPWDQAGDHTRGKNHDSLGICFVGNYDEKPPFMDAYETGARLIRYWLKQFNIDINHIYGHRYFSTYKTCPGKKFDLITLKQHI